MTITNTIDPSLEQQPNYFYSYLSTVAAIAPYTKAPTSLTPQGEELNLSFTYGMYSYTKPERESRKTKQKKPSEKYIAVVDPESLGGGAYGSVYPIIGVWRFRDNHWQFKSKTADKVKLVKTNYPFDGLIHETANDQSGNSYQEEFEHGKYVPHMGQRYPPTENCGFKFLQSRKQPGRTLCSLIEELRKNPNLITVEDRIRITRNLLDALKNQVSEIYKDGDKQNWLIHRDLKPENILVDDQWNIKIIDYGLAAFIKEDPTVKGNVLYMDPSLIARLHDKPSRTSDLAAISRIIAELWGDTSAVNLENVDQLHARNFENRLVDLLKGINYITEAMKNTLIATIRRMVFYQENLRFTLEELSSTFKNIHNSYLSIEKRQAEKIATSNSLLALDAAQFLRIFNSPYADELVKTILTKEQYVARVLDLFKNNLFAIPNRILDKLKLNLKHYKITLKLIADNNYTPQHIERLMHWGAVLEPDIFEHWLRSPSVSRAGIGRILYRHTEREKVNTTIAGNQHLRTFNALFCRHYLIRPETEKNDRQNVRLLLRHLKMKANDRGEIVKIQNELVKLGLCHFTKSVNKIMCKQTDNKDLVLTANAALIEIRKNLVELTAVNSRVASIKNIRNITERDQALNRITKEIEELRSAQYEPTLMNKLSSLSSRIKSIIEIDSYITILELSQAHTLLTGVIQQVHAAYSKLDNPLNPEQIKKCQLIVFKIEDIEHYRAEIARIFPISQIPYDEDYLTLLKNTTIDNSALLCPQYEQLKAQYHSITHRYHQLQHITDSFIKSRKAVFLFLKNTYVFNSLEQWKSLLDDETEFRNNFLIKSDPNMKIIEFVYSLIEHHLNKNPQTTLSVAQNVFSAFKLINAELLEVISQHLRTSSRSVSIESQFAEKLWHLLSEHHTHPEKTTENLNDLLGQPPTYHDFSLRVSPQI